MARPSILPQWATDAIFGSGPKSGQNTKLEPAAGTKSQGHYPNSPSGAQNQNWWQNLVYRWLSHLDEETFAYSFRSYLRSASGAVAIGNRFLLGTYQSVPGGAFNTLDGDKIQVPIPGLYSVELKCAAFVNAAANPQIANFWFKAGTATFGWATGQRFNGAAGDSFSVSGIASVWITDPATQLISVENWSGATAQPAAAASNEHNLNPLIITYLGKVAL